jgi:hypothetical protein
MRRVRWHAESDNLVLCTELIELRRSVAAVTIKDKETIYSMRTRRCMSVKVLYPLNSKLISCLAIIANCEYLFYRDVVIPASLVELPREDHERRKTLTKRVDTLNCGNLVSIA